MRFANSVFKKHILIIAVVSMLASWPILLYYFSYEDLSFFYAYQNYTDYGLVFDRPEFQNHPFFRHYFLLFQLLKYNPLPYQVINIAIFFFISLGVYYFALSFGINKNKSLFSALLISSGYYGIETFTWHTFAGLEGGLGVLLTLMNLITFNKLTIKFEKKMFGIFLFLYFFVIFFFPARSYFLPVFFMIIFFFKSKNVTKSIALGFLTIIPLFLILSNQANRQFFLLQHIDFRFNYYIYSVFANLGRLFLPSTIILSKTIAFIFGLIFSLFALINKETRVLFLLLFSSIALQLFAVILNTQYFDVYESYNHFFTTFIIFSWIIVAVLLKNKSKVIIFIIVINLILSNYQIIYRLINHSNELRYFYTNIVQKLKLEDRKTAVLFYLSAYKRPISPFVSGMGTGNLYLPGFYSRNKKDMMVTEDFDEYIKFIRDNNVNIKDCYIFYYSKYNLQDVSIDARKLLKDRNIIQIDSDKENVILSGLVPVKISFDIQMVKSEIKDTSGVPKEKIDDFLKWDNQIKVETFPQKAIEGRKLEYLIDNDYDTTWIPSEWKNPVKIIFHLPEKKNIGRIVWSVSRNLSWPQRSPSDYDFFASSNEGKTWVKIKSIKNGKGILTNEYKVEQIDYLDTMDTLRFDIYKTTEGALPAIDDVDIIPKELDGIGYEILSRYLVNQKAKVCVQWKTIKDNQFRDQRMECVKVEYNNKTNVNIYVNPNGEKITGIRIVDDKGSKLVPGNLFISYQGI